MRAPCPEARRFHDHPVAFRKFCAACVRGAGAGGEDLCDPFVARDGGGGSGGEGGVEGGLGGVDALKRVYVCGIYGAGEEAERAEGAVRGREGMAVKAGLC